MTRPRYPYAGCSDVCDYLERHVCDAPTLSYRDMVREANAAPLPIAVDVGRAMLQAPWAGIRLALIAANARHAGATAARGEP